LIPPGTADVLIGMEALELLRNLALLDPKGYYILNRYCVPTVYTNLGIDRYPSEEEILREVKKVCPRGVEIEATFKAAQLGNPQMTNVIILGALAKVDEFFAYQEIRKLVESASPPRFAQKNLEGFEAGYALA
jgi:indolepyruvate ferredoxin oxidoreductase beta subunit